MSDSERSQIPSWVADLLKEEFVLPEARSFESVPVKASWLELIRLSERYLPFSNGRADFTSVRLARKFDEPFEL